MNTPALLLPMVTAAVIALTALPTLAQEAAPAPEPASPASTLPGGASSLTERYGDWTMTCAMARDGKQCVFSQVLGDSQTGQRTLSIELRAASETSVTGMLLAPFSLKLASGVGFAIDGTPLSGPVPFLACLPEGCLVPVTFQDEALTKLRAGTMLEVSATPLNSNEPIELPISLAGFTAAFNRTAELAN